MNIVKNQAVKNYLKEKSLTKTEFCKRCNIAVATLNKILDGQKINIVPILKIVDCTELKMEDFFEPITNEKCKG